MIPTQLPFPVMRRQLPGVTLEVASTGTPNQPLVILLHGFPDLWQSWHAQMAALAERDYRVLAPNQRGYGHSDKPAGIASYDIDRLAQDVVDLAASEAAATFQLVGHDWGGIIAWRVAMLFPSQVERLIVINAPHPGIFHEYARRHLGQILRSWYIGAFQIPWLPEWVLSRRRHALLFRAVQGTSLPGVFDESDRQVLQHGWSQPGALTGMLNYYRANVRRNAQSLAGRVTCPTRIFFGRKDPTEEPGLAEASCRECDQGQVMWFDECAHWPHREQPERATAALLEFLRSPTYAVSADQ